MPCLSNRATIAFQGIKWPKVEEGTIDYRGAIAAGDPQTVSAGAEMLQQGGNAVDAAVGAAFTAFVSEWAYVHICGGGMALVRLANSSNPIAYDFLCAVPLKAATSRKAQLAHSSARSPDWPHHRTMYPTATVPGAIAGLCSLLSEHGQLPLGKVLEPAVRLAREGALVSPCLAEAAEKLAGAFHHSAILRQLYYPADGAVKSGERLVFSNLARMMETLAGEGPHSFYGGRLTEALVDDQRRNGGLITADDFLAYQVRRLQPFAIDYREKHIIFPPLPSSGSVMIAFSLKLLESIDIPALAFGDYHHLRAHAETFRLANIARRIFDELQGGDEERINLFLTQQRLQHYREELAAILQGDAMPIEPYYPDRSIGATHISAVDADGLAISLTMSAGDLGECPLPVSSSAPKKSPRRSEGPEGYTLQRPPTMMSPILIQTEGHLTLALGSSNGNQPCVTILQVISNLLDFEMSPKEAIEAPRFQFEDDALLTEEGWRENVLEKLERSHYNVRRSQGKCAIFGSTQAAGLTLDGLCAASDSRRGGSVALV